MLNCLLTMNATPREDANDSCTLPSYGNPPLIEVACGVVFRRLDKMKIPHYGRLWERLRDNYPTCEHAPPIEVSPDAVDATTGLPLPRIWLVGKTGNDLIQIQNDRILYNWRKTRSADLYPRFQSVIENFKTSLTTFIDFLMENDLGSFAPLNCELTYVNHLVKGEGWRSPAEIPNLFPDLQWRSGRRFLPEPSSLAWTAVFPMEEDFGTLSVKLNQGTRKTDALPVLVLQLTANGLGADRSVAAIWKWFEGAHRWIVCGFADLTSTTAQSEIWKRED